ncbi:MAG: aminopeptidase P family protein [Myxococcota bacterium]
MEDLLSSTTLTQRQQEAAARLEGLGTLVVWSGTPVTIPGGQDQVYPFHAHPEYYWLTGSRRSGGALVLHEGRWTHYARPVTEEEALWEGGTPSSAGPDVAGLPDWLAAHAPSATHLGAPPMEFASRATSALGEDARQRLDTLRRPKDADELALMERAVAATAAGHAALRGALAPGVSERELQIVLEAATFRAGAERMGYGTIVGFGSNAAVLHFTPSERRADADELVLVDAGGAIAGYTADVTRTWPVSGTFSARQRAIYDVVRESNRLGVALCVPGAEWHEVHRRCAGVLAEGLADLGLLRVGVEEALASEAIALFMPHGIGHMVGLGVRDVGGKAPGREVTGMCCGVRVRVDLPLEPGYIMTVEPGLYFVPGLLDDPIRRERFAREVDWEAVDRWRSVGGVRIEDDVLVTEASPRNLTGDIAYA